MEPARRRATRDDLFAIPDDRRFHELIGGEVIAKATPSGEHGDAQAGIVVAVRSPFQRRSGRGGPGGWWILTEVEIVLATGDVVRPDVVGWRHERCPERPTGTPIELRPDWICEVISPTKPNTDTVKKLHLYHRVEIPHYWLVDTRDQTLTVQRWSADGYITVRRAERDDTVRAEPFDAIEIAVATLFGGLPED